MVYLPPALSPFKDTPRWDGHRQASVAIHPTIAEEFVTFGGWGQDKSGEKARHGVTGNGRTVEGMPFKKWRTAW